MLPDGTRRAILRRLRVEQGPDGSIRVASDLLPDGTSGPVMTIPDRLGGGTMYLTTAGGTLVHRAPSFLAPLEPLARFRAAPLFPVAATDRVLLRAGDGSRMHALSLSDGQATSPVGIPVAPRIGAIAFADAFHGLAVADLLGLVVTTDAGASWRPVAGAPEGTVATEIIAQPDGYEVMAQNGRYTVDLDGQLAQTEAFALPPQPTSRAAMATARLRRRSPRVVPPRPDAAPPVSPLARPGPLGMSPAQTTVERGIQSGPNEAVVAAGGRVVRVNLTDFSVLDLSRGKTTLDRDDSCRSVVLGAGVAFVCGGEGTGTSIHATRADLSTEEIVRFRMPRTVRATGQGALAVTGSCEGDAPPTTSEVCVLDGIHPPHTIRLQGDSGRERIVPLSDGRVVILEPPRVGSDGRAIVVRGDGSKSTIPLSFSAPDASTDEPSPPAEESPDEPIRPTLTSKPLPPTAVKKPLSPRVVGAGMARPSPKISAGPVAEAPLREGFWTHDWTEVSLGELATWVVSGAEVRGVRVDLSTGQITSGTPHTTAQTSIAGLHAFTLNDGGRGADTVDGGKTWAKLDQPEMLKSKADPARVCSSIGCVLRFAETPWVRVGWGEPEDATFVDAAAPRRVDDLVVERSFSLDCDEVKLLPARKEPPKKPPPVRTSSTPLLMMDGDSDGSLALRVGDWDAFRGFAGPTLPKGFGGYDAVSAPSGIHAALYAWAPYGAMSRDASRWQGRFFDKYEAVDHDGVRSSAVGTTPYGTEEALATALGYRSSVVALQPLIDPGGHAALVGMGDSSGNWELVSLVEGRAPARMAPPPGGTWPQILPSQASAAYIESLDAWVVATEEGALTELRLTSAGQTRALATLPRVGMGSHDPVMVVRRAQTTGVGVLVGGMNAASTERVLHVLPIDLDNGHIGEIHRLGPTSLTSRPLRACEPGEDGWLVDMGVGGNPTLHLPHGGRVGDPSVRARLDEGKVCLDAIAAKLVASGDEKGANHAKHAAAATTKRKGFGVLTTLTGTGTGLSAAISDDDGIAAGIGGLGQVGGIGGLGALPAPGAPPGRLGGGESPPPGAREDKSTRTIPLAAVNASGARLTARCRAR